MTRKKEVRCHCQHIGCGGSWWAFFVQDSLKRIACCSDSRTVVLCHRHIWYVIDCLKIISDSSIKYQMMLASSVVLFQLEMTIKTRLCRFSLITWRVWWTSRWLQIVHQKIEMFQEIGLSITQKMLEMCSSFNPRSDEKWESSKTSYCSFTSSFAVSFMINYERQNLVVKVLFTQTSYNSKELMHRLTPNVPRTPTSRRTAGTPGAPQPTVAAEFAFPSRVNPWEFHQGITCEATIFHEKIIAETVDQREFYAKTLLEFQRDNGTWYENITVY